MIIPGLELFLGCFVKANKKYVDEISKYKVALTMSIIKFQLIAYSKKCINDWKYVSTLRQSNILVMKRSKQSQIYYFKGL